MSTPLAALAAALLLALPAAGASPAGPRPPHETRLVCGGGVFTLRETPAQSRDLDGPVAQSLVVVRGRAKRRIRLDMAGLPLQPSDDEDRLPAYVGGMVCLPARGGASYVQLEYVCNALSGAQPQVCGGEREWFRYLDTSGRRTDAGYAPQDRRYEALRRRLGF